MSAEAVFGLGEILGVCTGGGAVIASSTGLSSGNFGASAGISGWVLPALVDGSLTGGAGGISCFGGEIRSGGVVETTRAESDSSEFQISGIGISSLKNQSIGIPIAATAMTAKDSARILRAGLPNEISMGTVGGPRSSTVVISTEIGGNIAPQPAQTVVPASVTLPHTGQGFRSSGTPQDAQKRSPGRLSCWQLGHRVNSMECAWAGSRPLGYR